MIFLGRIRFAEPRIWWKLLYGWSRNDIQSRHPLSSCTQRQGLFKESLHNTRGRRIGEMRPTICGHTLHLVLRGIYKR